ncbi:MAG: S8 family peptidase [Acidobacteria bacterium]|nr:S8 family peptidase [Acidobacteriota bacterium]
MTRSRIISQAAILTVALCAAAAARSPKIAREFDATPPGSIVDVIIQYKQTPSASQHAHVHARGGALRRGLEVIRGGHYSLPASALEELAADPDVEFIHPDRPLKAADFNGKMDYGWMTVTGITSPTGKLPYDGSGVGVAIIDSGITGSSDLNGLLLSRIVYSENFILHLEMYGHGTHVAGIIAGNGAQSSGLFSNYKIRGVAPNVNLIDLHALESDGTGTDSSVIAAIQKAIALKSAYNIRVINLSLGRPVTGSYKNDPLCQAVEAAWKAGIVVVVAAGNDGRNDSAKTHGYGTITAPGNDPYVITVGALNTNGTASRTDDRPTSYSSKGPTLFDHIAKPDLLAPGNGICSIRSALSKLDTQYPGNRVPSSAYSLPSLDASYFQLSGTSMAAPMVSGAAALLLQKNPKLSPDQVKAILLKTANKSLPAVSTVVDSATQAAYTVYGDLFTVGAGSLDVAAALKSTETPSGAAASPIVNFSASNGVASVSVDGSSVWANTLVWGTSIVWGTNVIMGNTIVWGTSMVWGTASGVNAIFSNTLVWGTGGMAGETIPVLSGGEK